MPRGRREPRWLTRSIDLAIHEAQIRENGGSSGLRDENLFESALARPRHKLDYAPRTTLFALAAAYAFGIAKNHPFVDGNKRTAFMSAYTFLGLNGYDVNAAEPEVVTTVEALAAGSLGEKEFAAWLQSRTERSAGD